MKAEVVTMLVKVSAKPGSVARVKKALQEDVQGADEQIKKLIDWIKKKSTAT